MIKEIGKCPVCKEPLLCAPGQIIRFHKRCRIEGKKRFGKATGLRQFDVDIVGNLVPQTVVE